MTDATSFEAVLRHLSDLPPERSLVAIVGAPGSGKSTFAEKLCEALNATNPSRAALVPMDGFHYDDDVLREMGRHARKGAPDTFDVLGLDSLLARLNAANPQAVAVPLFDRSLEIARAAARIIPSDAELILVEGNYLLLDAPPWDGLRRHFNSSVFLDVPQEVLEARLMARWLGLGYTPQEARAKALENDLPNARHVIAHSAKPDWVVQNH